MADPKEFLFPKPLPRKPRQRKPIARRKPLPNRVYPLRNKTNKLNNRRKFKAHGSNPLKTYHRKYTDVQVAAHAQEKRRERLANPTEAEIVFSELLRRYGIVFEREAIFLNGDRFVLLDFWLPSLHSAFEIDGAVHERQQSYDRGRDKWLLERHGIRTIRFTNKEVLDNSEEVKSFLCRAIKGMDAATKTEG